VTDNGTVFIEQGFDVGPFRVVLDRRGFGKLGWEDVGGEESGGGEATEALDDAAGNGGAGEGGAGDSIDLWTTGRAKIEAEVGLPELFVFDDRIDVIRGVGGVDNLSVGKLAGLVEGEGEVGGAGVAFEMIGLRRGGEEVAEGLVFGVKHLVVFDAGGIWEEQAKVTLG
jgi:hypothetical protein